LMALCTCKNSSALYSETLNLPSRVSVFLNDENDESCAGFYSLTLRK
jgi:hypothetical protein